MRDGGARRVSTREANNGIGYRIKLISLSFSLKCLRSIILVSGKSIALRIVVYCGGNAMRAWLTFWVYQIYTPRLGSQLLSPTRPFKIILSYLILATCIVAEREQILAHYVIIRVTVLSRLTQMPRLGNRCKKSHYQSPKNWPNLTSPVPYLWRCIVLNSHPRCEFARDWLGEYWNNMEYQISRCREDLAQVIRSAS